MRRHSENDGAPAGMIMHSCTFRFPPACFPPFMMLSMGTGMVAWSPPTCSYTGTPSAIAPALTAASDTATMALPPRPDLFSVPSSSIMARSTASWSAGSIPTSALAMGPRTFSTAFSTPLPPYLDLSPSLISRASQLPVEAPDGAMALILCPPTVSSASTVGFPLESRTSLAHTFSICIRITPRACTASCCAGKACGPCPSASRGPPTRRTCTAWTSPR